MLGCEEKKLNTNSSMKSFLNKILLETNGNNLCYLNQGTMNCESGENVGIVCIGNLTSV